MACGARWLRLCWRMPQLVASPPTGRGQFGLRGCRPKPPGDRYAINLPLDHRFENAIAVVRHGFEGLLAAFQRESMADEIV